MKDSRRARARAEPTTEGQGAEPFGTAVASQLWLWLSSSLGSALRPGRRFHEEEAPPLLHAKQLVGQSRIVVELHAD